jgi:biotin carboxyl carrier protein
MEYQIRIDGSLWKVGVEHLEDRMYRVSFPDRDHRVDIFEVSENLYSLICDGQCFEVDTVEEADRYEVFIKGQSHWTEILRPEAERAPEAAEAVPAVPEGTVVEAPMNCKVIKILVQEGQCVEAEQILCILEAMKMEMPIGAPERGEVKRIWVREGQIVEGGEKLLILGPIPAGGGP